MQQLEFSQEELAAIRAEYCKGFTDEQFTLAISESKRRNLVPGVHIVFQLRKSEEWDPELRANTSVKKMVKMTTIDALRLISQRTNEYEGQGEGEFYYLDEKNMPSIISKIPLPHPQIPTAPREPWAAAIPIFRKGFREPVKVVARFDAYAVLRKNKAGDMVLGSVWARRGPEMLLKCAEAAARRAAFPEELAGLYLSEEFEKDQPDVEAPPPTPVVAAPTAPVVPTVNHTPAVISNEPRPGELVQIRESLPLIQEVLNSPAIHEKLKEEGLQVNDELLQELVADAYEEKAIKLVPPEMKEVVKKRTRRASIEDMPVTAENPEFHATDDDLPANMFEGPENVQKIYTPVEETPLTGKEIGEKVRSYYNLASQGEISKHILSITGAKTSKDVTQEQWRAIFAAFDTAKALGKEDFQQLLMVRAA